MSQTVDSRLARRWFTIAVVVLALWLVVMVLKPMRMPIIWAALLAFLMQPLQRQLTVRFRNRPSAAAGVLTGLTPVAIFAPLALLGIAFARQIAELASGLQANPQLMDFSSWQDPDAHPRIAALSAWVTARFSLSAMEIQGYLLSGLQNSGRMLAAASGQVFLNTAGTLLRFFLMLFILFFMLRDGQMWFDRAAALLPLMRGKRDALIARLGKVTRAVVYGCGLTAAVQGLMVGIGFAIAGLPGPVVFGVLAGVSALLPFGGAGIVWLPGALYMLATGSYGWGIFLLVWGGVVSTSDNFIRPVIISRYTPVPTLLVFLGVIGGVAAFGLIGFIFGPVILVLATELLRFFEASLQKPDDAA
jgi:predicted PurR-regulated permease PerM